MRFIQHSCLLLLPGCLSPSALILCASNENMLTANTPFNFTPHFPFALEQRRQVTEDDQHAVPPLGTQTENRLALPPPRIILAPRVCLKSSS